jgi:hypothetical protein
MLSRKFQIRRALSFGIILSFLPGVRLTRESLRPYPIRRLHASVGLLGATARDAGHHIFYLCPGHVTIRLI